ncbi:hypothetical protein AB0J43_16175 [Nonomuraea fuscirosea]
MRKTIVVIHVIASVALVGEVWGLVVLNTAATLANDPALTHSAYRMMSPLVFAGGIPPGLRRSGVMSRFSIMGGRGR